MRDASCATLEHATANGPWVVGVTVFTWLYAAAGSASEAARAKAAKRLEFMSLDHKVIAAAMDDSDKIRRILKTSRVIAVVGLSAQWHRPSYFAAKYMQEHGYRVIPVNPKYGEILGEKCYKSLREVPEKIDIVDVFRKTQDVMPIAEEAIAIGAKVLWQQLGVRNEAAAAK